MTSQPASDDTSNANEKIEVLYGAENIVNRTLQDLVNVKKTFDNFTDYTGPSVFLAYQPMWDACIALKQKGVRLRFITEITKDNISYCKDVMKVFELRHLDGVKGNFGIADGKDYGGAANVDEGDVPTQLIRSNVKAFVEQQQYFFETLWTKAIPAEQRIKEIEEGRVVEKTVVLYGTENVIDAELHFFSNARTRIDTYMNYTRPPLAIGLDQIRRAFLDAKGRDVKLRYLTEITKDNLSSCKEIMKIVDELRHLDDIKGNFMISESEYLAPTTSQEITRPAHIIIFSNVKEIVEHQQCVFDTFWNIAIPAEQKLEK